jgi:hypothetical protein
MTSRSLDRRRIISVIIVSAMVLWPLAHMPLSQRFRINPWKLGGFGMFAAPGDLDGGVHVGVVVFQTTGSGRAPLPAEDQSLAQMFRFRGWTYQTFPARANNYTYGQLDFTSVRDGLATPIDLGTLPEDERLRAFDLVTNVRLWHRHKYIARLAAHIERVALPQGRVDRIVVLVTSADMQVLQQRVSSETCVYVVRQGSVSSRGCFRAETLDRHRLEQALSWTSPIEARRPRVAG